MVILRRERGGSCADAVPIPDQPRPVLRAPPLIREPGFEILTAIATHNESGVERRSLAPRFRDLSDEVINTNGLFVHARKR